MKKRLVSSKKQPESSSADEDSDVERNFTLLTGRTQTEEEEQHHGGGEEEEESDGGGDEDEEGSDGGDETESDDDGEAEGDEDEDELSNMSFEDIEKLQNKVGTKVYNEVAYGSSKTPEHSLRVRICDFRPMEISAKKPAPFLRQVIPVRKPTLRDPRFDDLSGEYKPEIFEKTYKFINDIRHREKEDGHMWKRLLFKSASFDFVQENQERARTSREQQRERELQLKRQQRERAGQGGQPFFFKKSDVKKLQLAEKYQELKKSGKLENFLSKKRKRNATKDRRKLPKQLQREKASGH
uniref:rRNA biogenesis protein RRP36 n=1 Tax=Amphilophus citrinellus TaxID=61819 RepID=A0A3Q0SY28_AMPCI